MLTTNAPERHHPGDRIPLDSQPNFRDLGGYATTDGRRVRHGLLFRSGNLDDLTEADRKTIRGLKIRTVVDFRSESETQADEMFWREQEARYLHFPINPGNLATLFWEAIRTGDCSHLPEDILAVNNRLIVYEARSQYGELFRLLSDSSNLPLLFNCSHGKDRTGVAAVLTLLALGSSNEDAKSDYLLSNRYREQENNAQLDAVRESVKDETDVDLRKLEAAFTLQPHHFDIILQRVDELNGGLDAYFRDALGVSDRCIAAMQDNLLEPGG